MTSEVCWDARGDDIYNGQRSHLCLALFHMTSALDLFITLVVAGLESIQHFKTPTLVTTNNTLLHN